LTILRIYKILRRTAKEGIVRRPLDGLVVADLSRVLAGPLATQTLADLGATVVKVEHPVGGDDTRSWGPPWSAAGSSYFDAANRSKQSIALDLDNPDDLAVCHRLVERADVLVENFRVGSLAKHGLDPAATRARWPRLVHCSITGFGSGGGAALPGYDVVVQALGGLMSITGEPDGDPQKVGVALVDVLTSKDAVTGILAALRHRDLTGLGQVVEVNLLQSLLASLANQASSYLATGVPPSRLGNQHPSIAPYETLQCADGLLVVACGNDEQFRRLCQVLGIPQIGSDPRFAANPARVVARHELRRLLEARLAGTTAAVWQARLTEVGVPAGEVQDVAGGFDLALRLGLEPLVRPAGEDTTPLVAHPVTYSGFTATPARRPPTLSEHAQQVRDWLAGPVRPLQKDNA
jgi:crotonobetainyl-CoA:carnitine CoA-transferase CaiB-like acyl-CoA transferase